MAIQDWKFASGNVVDEIYDNQEQKAQIRKFFQFSPLWRTLKKFLAAKDDRKEVLISPPYDWAEEKEYLEIVCHRGTGYAVRFLDAAIYGRRGESPHVEVSIEIEWDNRYESFTKKYSLQIPVGLCREFSQEAFDKWIEKAAADRRKKEAAACLNQLETLNRLLEKYPGDETMQRLREKIKAVVDEEV